MSRAALILSFLLGACAPPAAESAGRDGSTTPAGDAVEPAAKEPVLVRTGPLERRAIERVLETTADVVSLDVVDVFPERTQPVVELLVEEGDQVEPGQVLARLRDDLERLALAEAEVRLREAENAQAKARADHARNEALMARSDSSPTSLISERDFETSKMTLLTAETTRESAAVALDRARFELGQTVIRAPIGGSVGLREISLGDTANPSQRAFQLVDDRRPKAIFYRPQRELAELRVGQTLTATCEALPGVAIQGRIERIAPTVDAASGTVKVTAALAAERAIPIGVLARLRLVLDRHDDALLVPKKALLYEADRPYCFVVREERAVRVDLCGGFEEADCLEALPGGEQCLLAEDQVVLVGADRLADGDPVELAEGA